MSIPQQFPHFICAVLLFLWLLINVSLSKGQYLHLTLHKYRFKSWYRYSVRMCAWAGANLQRDQCSAPTLYWIYDGSETCVQLASTRLVLTTALQPWHWYGQAKCKLHQQLPLWGWEWRTNVEPKSFLMMYFPTYLCQATYRQQKKICKFY